LLWWNVPNSDQPPSQPEKLPRDVRIKKFLFQSRHRGMREADYLIGGFAALHLDELSDAELDDFERLLDVPDPDVVDWLLGRSEPPEAYKTRVLDLIIKFKNER
jgi:antitoxin CptB